MLSHHQGHQLLSHDHLCYSGKRTSFDKLKVYNS
jgi:hypothetical protein